MINILNKIIEFFKPKKELTNEELFKKALEDCLADKKSSHTIQSLESIGANTIIVTVFCDKKYWETMKYIEDSNFKLEDFLLKYGINKAWSMKGVEIKSVRYFKSLKEMSFNIFCKSAENIHLYKTLEEMKKMFPEGKRIDGYNYETYSEDFKKYGCTFSYKKGNLFIKYPKEKS